MMTPAFFITIAITGFTVALLHASLPTHWLPFVLVGRAQGWSRGKIMGIVALMGGVHVVITTAIGVAIAWLGFVIDEAFDIVVHRSMAGLLIVFAVYFWWRQLTGRRLCRHGPACDHAHHGEEGAASEARPTTGRAALWSLFALLVVSPCEGFLPVYLTAVPFGWPGVALLSAVLAFATLGGMLILTWTALAGWERFNSPWLEHHQAGLVGSLLALLGVFVFVVPT